MAFVTVGNLKRFLEKLKTYLGNNYLKKTGDTTAGRIVFGVSDSSEEPEVYRNTDALAGIKFSSSSGALGGIGKRSANGTDLLNLDTNDNVYPVLDSKNYTTYTPKLDGTGATGTWPINITGNAVNDSDGNKIVDTYAKKTDVPTGGLTNPMTEDLKMGENKISFGPDGSELPIYYDRNKRLSIGDAILADSNKLYGTSVIIFGGAHIEKALTFQDSGSVLTNDGGGVVFEGPVKINTEASNDNTTIIGNNSTGSGKSGRTDFRGRLLVDNTLRIYCGLKEDITLYASNWSDGTYTIPILGSSYRDPYYTIFDIASTATDEQFKALGKAHIVQSSINKTTLVIKALGTVPTVDIPVTILSIADSGNVS